MWTSIGVCLLSVLVTSDACWWSGANKWESWGSCSARCGGGIRRRQRDNCGGGIAYSTGRCNEFCYNGVTYSHGCHCPAWRSGRCCENCRQGTITHCKQGRQVCGGHPDSVRCTECDHLYKPAGWGKGCERKTCRDDNGGCEQTCSYIRGIPTCSCLTGFQLHNNHFSCIDINECSTGAAPCTQVCTNVQGSYRCSCDPGFSLDTDGYTCSGIDQCQKGTDNCDQLCLNKLGTFQCGCRSGYILDVDERTCNDIDECSVNTGGCDQICINERGSYHCQCQVGYVLDSENKCIDVDECADGNARCTQNCTNTPGSYFCHCKPGFEMEADGFTCSDIDDCIGISCFNDGTCSDHVNSYSCSCTRGYKGDHCENDINECVEYMQGGCEDECINTDGSYRCSCYENRTLDTDRHSCSGGNEGRTITVFERESVFRKLLPRGCNKIILSKCNEGEHVEFLLSSTSSWYKLASNASVMYTDGVVFAEVNDLSLPVSITGMTVEKTETDIRFLTGSLRFDDNDGIKFSDVTQHQHCWSFDLSPRDIHDFLSSNSFLRTFFEHLRITLPNWLQFSDNGSELLELSGIKSELIRGSDVDRSICRGAPVHYDRWYTMLIFNHEVSLSFYGEEITLPKSLAGKSYCFLIDICRDLGSTIFLLLPPEARNILNQITLFANLKDKYHLSLRPRGIGLSMKKSINANAQQSEMQFWNGDQTFSYPISAKANFWIGGDAELIQSVYRFQGESDVYLSIPSPLQLLSGVFREEWDIQLSANMKSSFIIPLFGKLYYLDFGEAAVDGYGSVGGEDERSWCGQSANPPGLFVSFFATVNPFIGIPLLEHFGPTLESKIYAFVTFDPNDRNSKSIPIDLSKEMFALTTLLSNMTLLCRDTSNKYNGVLSAESQSLLLEISHIGTALEQQSAEVVRSLSQANLSIIITKTSELWKELNELLKKKIETFIESIEFDTMGANGQLASLLESELNLIKKCMSSTLTRIVDEVFNFVNTMNGFGVKFHGELDIFGIKIIGADIELVYSVDRLESCSQYVEMFEILKGEKAVRFKIGISSRLIRIAPLIRLDVGSYLTLAGSTIDREKIIAQSKVSVSVLGITASVIMTVSPRQVVFRLEGRIWDSFLAELQCSAYHNKDWQSLVIDVHGKLLAKGGHESNFDGSYLDGLRRIFQKVADGASARIGAAQSALSKAQSSFTDVQNWLESKKEDIRRANRYWDEAVHELDIAKDKLEEAKEPFKHAIDKLDAAQRKVDNLCRIHDCRRICIPGISCKICHKKIWFVNFPYPCCHFTDCMISFPDPICVLRNLGCRAIRGLAYIALEAAKIFVRIPMLALDAAKLVVSGAQIVVDKSRVVLDVAIAAIDVAELGLDVAKGVLEAAKLALEGVKFLIKGAVKVLNFVIKEGIERIIDVKDCQFNVKVGSNDPQVFDISCRINPFTLGWVEIGIRINFKDAHRSLWNAAKGTVDTLVEHASNRNSQRKKRELNAAIIGKVHRIMRNTRDIDLELDDIFINLDEKIDAIINTPGMRNLSSATDYDNRVNIFAEKCESYTLVSLFMIKANGVLQGMVTETADILDHLKSKSEELKTLDIDRLHEHLSFDSIGLNTTTAVEDFNITTDQMETEINNAKANITNDPILSQIPSLLDMSKNHIKDQQDNVDKVQVVSQWIAVMENVSQTYFDNNTCVSFIDCMHFAITTLYSLHEEENHANVYICLDAITAWEDIFLNLTFRETHTIQSVRDMSVKLQNQMDVLEDANVFCSIAPKLTLQPSNTTVGQGTTITVFCEATGDPKPDIWWYKNGELLTNETESVLTLRNVTENDTSRYSCVVGNIVANLTSNEAHVFVTDDYVVPSKNKDPPKVSAAQGGPDIVGVVIGSCSFLFVSVGIFLSWRRYKRYHFKKEVISRSVASLKMVRPYSAASKGVFDPAKIKS